MLWQTLRKQLRRIDLDIARYEEVESRPRSLGMLLRLILITPGFQFVLARRIQDVLYAVPVFGRLLGRVSWWWICIVFSSELAIDAEIEGGLYIPHPYGIVVGRCSIGPRVTILQNVTIGKLRPGEIGHPRLGAGVSIGAGSTILGPITLGEGAVVGANSLVRTDIPPGTVAVGSPARVVAAA